ncbi:MAG TPA: 30S ribosomal protein S9 [Candidatus Saccharimonadales bacterium]|nr:30S ribosomal protein S9 [Candidatus Saccharimonadales bacterium]
MAEQVVAKKGTADLEKELSEFNESQPQIQAKRPRGGAKKAAIPGQKKPARKKKAVVVERGKRKRAIARASMSSGSGRILINGVSAQLIKPKEIRDLILEPIIISKKVSDIMKEYDVNINVYGGGIMGQAQASRTALAKAIVRTTQNDGLKRAYMLYDRSILVEDHRRVEPKKFGGPKARARNQTSYR